MQQVRVFRGIQSRTKHRDAPKTKVLDVTRKNGAKESIELGFAEAPVVYAFPVFAVPGLLDPDGYESGIRVAGLASYAFGPTPEHIAEQLDLANLIFTEKHKYTEFARMLAKMAYSSIIGQATEVGVDSFVPDQGLLSAILGETDDIGRWVGTLTKPFERHDGLLHRIRFGTVGNTDMVMAEVQLFADSGTPHYGVVLGRGTI
jgi:hypothetical protein